MNVFRINKIHFQCVLLCLQAHALVTLNIWDIYNARWYFPGVYTKYITRCNISFCWSSLLVLQSSFLAYIFCFSCTVSFIPLDLFCTRLLRFLSAIFLCSSARNRAFPDNSPSLGNNWIRVTSTAREAEQEDGGARGRGHFAFEIEKRRIYKRQWLKRGKWPCIVPLAVAAIRLDGSAVRSAGC